MARKYADALSQAFNLVIRQIVNKRFWPRRERNFSIRIEAFQIQDSAAEFAEDLQRHQHAVLAIQADSAINHRMSKLEHVRACQILDFQFSQHWENPGIEAVPQFYQGLTGIVPFATPVGEE